MSKPLSPAERAKRQASAQKACDKRKANLPDEHPLEVQRRRTWRHKSGKRTKNASGWKAIGTSWSGRTCTMRGVAICRVGLIGSDVAGCRTRAHPATVITQSALDNHHHHRYLPRHHHVRLMNFTTECPGLIVRRIVAVWG